MEDQAQKMLALKKAYANIILNTGKEAAARIMASERRAVQFQQELSSTKDEALRMLVRLKQMIDAKTAEAEMTSLNNQRKFEELEAQLNEAEDVITDLRAELKHVWLELEKTKNTQNKLLEEQSKKQVASVELEKTMNTQNQLLEEQIKKQAAPVEESAKQDVTLPIPIQQRKLGTPCDVKNVPLNQNVIDDKCCNEMKQTESCCIANSEDYYAHNSSLSSIIMRGKEPELYKNGCTQRIRALEGKLLNDKLLTQDEQNGHFGVNCGFVIKDSDKEVAKFSTLSSITKKMKIKKHVKRHGTQKGKTFSYLRSCFIPCCKRHIDEDHKSDKGACSLPSIKSCAINKSRRTKRCRPVRKKSSVHDCCKPSFTLKQCSSVSNNDQCCEDEDEKPVPYLTDTEPVHGSSSDEQNIRMVSKFELMQETAERDKESLDACIFENLTGGNEMKLAYQSGNMEAEVVDVSCTNTDLEDTKAFEENNESSGQADDRKLLKYTFCRKRKKESLDGPEEKTNSEESTVKRRVDEKQNGDSEPQKSSLMDESSRDSRRLAQVARQLISLSAKRW
ncbi:hypothetical protein QN277_020652 [Acacia crassicarpa]|uniref:Uncharacterized protein n=1 Tax=Acacia crassicarpa TaxID=499986 RepID=A0AAE1MST8_9FABA|nr:hypothetical protein QN277_020652 [Acacia crassicarpa]